MRTAIVYWPRHHGSTAKLDDAIVAARPELGFIGVAGLGKMETPDLLGCQLVGCAAGERGGKK